MQFALRQTDALLSTTRAVRKRLDMDRPVPREVIEECLQLAVQAPTASNSQTWRWLVIDDADLRARIAEIYRTTLASSFFKEASHAAADRGDAQTASVYDSADWLADNIHNVPVFVIPCVEGRLEEGAPVALQASVFGSIYPAMWSFQLALRSRGLGSTLTTIHLFREKEVAEILGLPDTILQVALLPVAYTKGTNFKPAARGPISEITHWNGW
ncbi:MAG: nitroreductase family protein [Alphaproteobacteria bacterium]|nr:nitroreductase family protein [Alphaproteobacteria bacterium]